MKNSIIITFEGIEGSGKSTQIQLLKNALKQMGLSVHLFREPGGTKLGEEVRRLLLDPELDIDPLAELMLFISSRVELLNTQILPTFHQSPCVIILDRFKHSSIAYQGAGRELGVEKVKELHNIEPLNTLIDATFFLDISAEKSQERVESRNEGKDKMELLEKSFFERVRKAYLKLERQDESILYINADQDIQVIHQKILNFTQKIIENVS